MSDETVVDMASDVYDNSDSVPAPAPQHPSVEAVTAKFNNLIDWVESKVNFKTDKALGVKRPSFMVNLPVPSVEGIVEIIQNGNEKPKQLNLLLKAMQAVIYGQLRSQINELLQADRDISAKDIDVGKLTWEYISTLTEAEKAVSAITKETWDAFQKNYVEVITHITKVSADAAGLAAKIMAGKFRKVAGKKKVLQHLQGQLDIWYANCGEAAEDFSEVYELLSAKVVEMLAENEDSMLENLGVED